MSGMSSRKAPGLHLANRQTLSDSTAAALRDAIFKGIFKAGDRLPQAHVAEKLGVSQAPVREALVTLEREGLVERGTRNGAAVTSFSVADIEEICSLRVAFETLGIRLACRRATFEDFDQMEATIEATERES